MPKNNIVAKEIKKKELWENYNLNVEHPSYFQSWNWGEVQKKAGILVFRYGFFRSGRPLAIAQMFVVRAKRGSFLHIRQGPVLLSENKEIVDTIFKFLKSFGEKQNVSFIRISPLLKEESRSIDYFTLLGFRQSPVHNVDAENRWVLKLDKDLMSLLSSMRKTTRYLIKKGESMKIKITRSTKINDIGKFIDLYTQTAKLKHFIPHRSLREEFEQFKKENKTFLYFATLGRNLLSSAMVVYYGKEVIYRHGATTIDGRNTPASYLVQWQAIKDAKKNGMSLYNFWGISKTDNPKNPWYGLTQFKKGFGGEQVDFVHSMDLPLKTSYWFSYLIDYLTKLKKGHV